MLRYRGLLFSVCRRYSSAGLEVDDLLQETTLALWNLRKELFGITLAPKQAAWIWQVARSRCIDLLRRTPQPELLAKEYDKPLENNALHDELIELIELLEEPDRTIAKMHLQGYEYKEIARATGMTKDNVGIRLMRIKEKLKTLWNAN